MAYKGAVKINKKDPKGDVMDVGFVVNCAFDKKGRSIPITDRQNKENLILEAIEKQLISSAFTEMRALKPKRLEGTYLYNEETNIKDGNGEPKYRHVVQLSGKQLHLVYAKGQDAVLQNENKEGIQKLMLGCRCKVGEVANARDTQKLKQWKKNGAEPDKKPVVRPAGLFPRFNATETFGPAETKVTPETLKKLDAREQRVQFYYRKMEKEKMMGKLEELKESLELQEPSTEKDFQLGE